MKTDETRSVLEWTWREYFSRETLALGEKDLGLNKLVAFHIAEDGHGAQGRTVNGFTVTVRSVPTTYPEYRDYPRWDRLVSDGKNNPNHYSHYFSCDCSLGMNGARCRHLANLMLRWERKHGPFIIRESEAERAERIEAARREREIERKKHTPRRAEQCFAPLPNESALYFKPDAILNEAGFETNQYEVEKMQALLREDPPEISMETTYSVQHTQNLLARASFENQIVRIRIGRHEINDLYCTCGESSLHGNWSYNDYYHRRMCGHALALWALFRQKIAEENPGDETDINAHRLLELMTDANAGEDLEDAVAPAVKKPCVALAPRILPDPVSGTIKLAFDIGVAGQRMYALRSLDNLCREAENDGLYKLTPKQTLSFAEYTFTEEAMKWYRMIQARVRATEQINRRLRYSYSYYGNGLATGDSLPLEDRELDEFYDMVEGGELLYQYGNRNQTGAVQVRWTHPKARVRIEPVIRNKRLRGIRLSGDMPRLMRGADYSYSLDDHVFGRVDSRDMQVLSPLRAISDAQGHFSCIIGERKYADFYYRALPTLQNADQIELDDRVGGMLEGLVPPEPEFTFFIDLNDARLSCETEVRYNGAKVGPSDLTPRQRDLDQEQRVDRAVAEYFPRRDGNRALRWVEYSEDALVELLTAGVAALSGFGEVRGSEAFGRVHMVPAPQPRLSLRVEGGLLDLSIQTKDISPEELLELLDSYRRRRRWHRLKSGDFVDLTGAEALDELNDAIEAMDVPLDQLIREGVRVPKYRALYVDRLLEAHDALSASRDRQFKALIRSFQTIRDSDFEVSPGLADVLRPYQVYGFRWLSTLAQSGFGGILADEMGLGKTIQLLAFVQAQRDAGETRPSLVVCPASLVYNWREECRKFTPDVSVQTLDGTLPQRKKLIKSMGEDGHAMLYITSYDLLKRDITLYDGMEFATAALDEAQYIKNQRAAVSKAVRVLKAEHRFALTGTPIENRLSELWSIFDFLMPGFLYSAAEFSTRFEGPVMKQKDPAVTARLSRMTEPFILRRRKADVLKDLPEKLEETRAFAMEPDQRKLYDAQVVHMRQMLSGAEDLATEKMRILAEITRLRQLCCDPSLLLEDYAGTSAKRAACLELIQNAIDAGHRMLVFSQFTSMLELLAADLKGAGIAFYTITGATSKQDRFRLVNDFNAGDVPVFLISLKAGGTGLNLTGADVVIHYDPWWNLAVQNQATDRAHRIGQTRQVTVIRLIAAETIEEKIVELQEAKRELAESIISGEGGSLMSLSREELMELLG